MSQSDWRCNTFILASLTLLLTCLSSLLANIMSRVSSGLTLATLPGFVLAQIFSFTSSSNNLIEVWLTGDKTLQHNLSSNLTTINVHGLHKSYIWPRFLGEFKKLRKLYFAAYMVSTALSIISQHLQLLPSTLEELSLFFLGADLLLFQPDEIPSIRPNPYSWSRSDKGPFNAHDKTLWNLAAHFPRLRVLKLYNYSHTAPGRSFFWIASAGSRIYHLPSLKQAQHPSKISPYTSLGLCCCSRLVFGYRAFFYGPTYVRLGERSSSLPRLSNALHTYA